MLGFLSRALASNEIFKKKKDSSYSHTLAESVASSCLVKSMLAYRWLKLRKKRSDNIIVSYEFI